ncbi:MAG: hypothetical protein QOE11_178 [Solirubrobacteraceae bacterium]|nr:hypothetical protein [Solirubrobacteraceae bacterium]
MLIPRKTLAAVLLAGGLAVTGCGGGGDSSSASPAKPPPPGNAADRAFVTAVIPLHEKSVAISIIGQTRGGAFVKTIAREVAGTQPEETARIRAIGSALFSAGVPIGSLGVAPTTAANVDLKKLRRAQPFDAAFLKAMIALHAATIDLSKAEIAKGSQVDLKTGAQAMIDAETNQLKSMRRRAGSN